MPFKPIYFKNFCASLALSVSSFILATGSAYPLVQNSSVQQDVITVTAQRREEQARNVSIALSVFEGKTLRDLGVKTVNDLESYVPSLEVESQFGSGQPSFSIRGVGFRDYASNNASTVGIYVDDIAYTLPVMTQGVLFDIERVEVLRGPQGTLYGRNTTGGAIKLISASPTPQYETGHMIEIDSFGKVSGEGYFSGPLSDKARGRLSISTSHGGAWQINRETGQELGDKDLFALRALADIDLSNTITARLNLHGYQDKSDGLGLQLFNNSVYGPAAHWAKRSTSWGSSQEFANLVGFSTDQAPFRDNLGFGGSVQIKSDHQGWTLNYTGAFETLDRAEFNDYDALTIGGAGVYFQTDAQIVSHEVRAVSNADTKIRWVLGGFYAREELEELYQSDFVTSFGKGFAVSTPYNQDVTTLAVYGHGAFDLTRRTTLIAGLRYEDEERNLRDLGTFATGFGSLNFANNTTNGTREDRDLNTDNLSGKLGLDFTVSDSILAYASYSRGIKSGGFTAYNTLNPNAINPFQPEKLDAYELGFKARSLKGGLTVNAAIFFYDYKDQQVQSAIYDTRTSAVVGRIVNAPESEISGLELELVYQPNHWLKLGQSLGYKQGEFKQFQDLDIAASRANGSPIYIDRSGQALGFPELSYQGFIHVQTALSPKWALATRFDYTYRDALSLPLLGEAYRVEDYWLANANIELIPSESQWSFSLFAYNVFNSDYDETRNFFIGSGGIADIAAPGQPMSYGLRLAFKR